MPEERQREGKQIFQQDKWSFLFNTENFPSFLVIYRCHFILFIIYITIHNSYKVVHVPLI